MRFIAILHRRRAPAAMARAPRVFVDPLARFPAITVSGLAEGAPLLIPAFPRGKPDATAPENAWCADLALLYGKDGGLSPFGRAFWAFLALIPGQQEVGPPRPGQGLGLGRPPGGDPGMIAGQQDLRDRPTLELLRAGILRVFQ